jgi:predicted nucleotide-binding protein
MLLALVIDLDLLANYIQQQFSIMNHSGSLEELKTVITGSGHEISSVHEREHGYQIRTEGGGICNWYPSTGTLQIQGKRDKKDKLKADIAEYMGEGSADGEKSSSVSAPEKPTNPDSANKKVFVVHGHDDTAREQLELVLHKLGLDPFVLANTAGEGLTIIEALEKEIGPGGSRARFGIVLLTPDDMGYAKKDGSEEAQPRARQNVVLEMGMLISALGRQNVAILKKGHIEVPSDAQGVLYIPFNDHVKETVPKLVDRLRSAGFVLSPQKVSRASI